MENTKKNSAISNDCHIYKYPAEEDFNPIYDKGALALYKSKCRKDETIAMLSAMKMQLSPAGLSDTEWMQALSFSLDRYVQRLG